MAKMVAGALRLLLILSRVLNIILSIPIKSKRTAVAADEFGTTVMFLVFSSFKKPLPDASRSFPQAGFMLGRDKSKVAPPDLIML